MVSQLRNGTCEFGPFFVQFWLYDGTKSVNFPNFGEMIEDQIFHLKKYTWFQVCNFLLLFGHNIMLGNCFEEFWKMTSKRASRFIPSPDILQSFKILVLSYNLFHFVSIINVTNWNFLNKLINISSFCLTTSVNSLYI